MSCKTCQYIKDCTRPEMIDDKCDNYKPLILEKVSQIKPNVQFWPTIPDPIECDDNTLNLELDTFIKEHLEFSRAEEYVVFRAFIKLTWIAETLYTTPYLHFIGPKRSGKSRALEILQYLCLKGMLAANISPACVYHAIETWHPTLLCDESDVYTGKRKAERQDDIQYILNSGYRRGLKAFRMEDDHGKKILRGYDVFGPKAIAGTELLRETTADRCLPFHMTKSVKHKPVFINFPKAKEIRAKLHAWRLRQLIERPSLDSFLSFDSYTPTGREKTILSTYFSKIDNRLTELLLPLGVCEARETEVDKDLLAYAEDLNGEREAEERTSFDADLVRIIAAITPDEKDLFTTRTVTDVWNEGRPESAQWSPDSIGRVISRLGFKKDRNKTGTKAWKLNPKHLAELRDRYDVWSDEEKQQNHSSKTDGVFFETPQSLGTVCPQCNFITVNPGDLKLHIEAVHHV